jgi:hypothetical protein
MRENNHPYRATDNGYLTITQIMHRLLVPMWLRPESALWYAHMLYMARKFLGNNCASPSLEFGCMDGVNTVVLLGGEFGETFDVYREVRWNKNSHMQSTLDDDYFDTTDDSVLAVDIRTKPIMQFDYGVDWKDAHLRKSERMGTFNKLIKIDLKKPHTRLDSGSVRTIWAPNIYWSDNFVETLSELKRILHPDGHIVTIAPDKRQLEFMLYRFAKQPNMKWFQDLDRGRYENVLRHARSFNEWKSTFAGGGMEVTKHEMFIPATVAKVYDIGFRPMFPVFMNMYEKIREISEEDWLDLKTHWIKTIFHFLSPLCETKWMEDMDMEKGWHIFQLNHLCQE